MKKDNLLSQKAEKLRNKLSGLDSFRVATAKEILGEKESTLYWSLWKLAEKGYIRRIGKGLYSFEKKDTEIKPIISTLAKKAWSILNESGNQFFISGLDILSIFVEHVPEYFPTLLFINKYSQDEIVSILSKHNISFNTTSDYNAINKEVITMHTTNEFNYSQNGLASFEKAFVDLYYEITRKKYPLSLQELATIFLNMKRRISLNTNRLIKIASRRNIHYDIRYIVENKYITEKAMQFVKFIHGL
ncbi:MAG: hypothetical protein ISS46_02505 [Candidatus Omnitrophica bacterium]|nr:hypothetical protein [Candidatus Omnitrophota bacterium]